MQLKKYVTMSIPGDPFRDIEVLDAELFRTRSAYTDYSQMWVGHHLAVSEEAAKLRHDMAVEAQMEDADAFAVLDHSALPQWNHDAAIGFWIMSGRADGSDITPTHIRRALAALIALPDDELKTKFELVDVIFEPDERPEGQ